MPHNMEGAFARGSTHRRKAPFSDRAPPQLRPSGDDEDDTTSKRMMRQISRTELCRFWPNCQQGDNCSFAHGIAELQDRPDLKKTSLCPRWLKGTCTLSSADCSFAHGKYELRATQAFMKQAAKMPGSDDPHHARAASSSAAGLVPPGQAPNTTPTIPWRLIPSDASAVRAQASGEVTSRTIWPTQGSSSTGQWGVASDPHGLAAAEAVGLTGATASEMHGDVEIDGNHVKPTWLSDLPHSQLGTGVRVDESQIGASVHSTGERTGIPRTADPVSPSTHASMMRGAVAQGSSDLGPPSVRDSRTLEVISMALMLLAEGHDLNVVVALRL